MELVTIKLCDIKPYEKNPRKNDEAIAAVKESIRQCEYIAPIILDENNIILAGHTRYKALLELGWTEAQCVVKDGLTEEQKKKYRLLDNKTAEIAGWDFDLLDGELEELDFEGFDFGFMMFDNDTNIDDFFVEAGPEKEKEPKKIQCPHCGEWFEP